MGLKGTWARGNRGDVGGALGAPASESVDLAWNPAPQLGGLGHVVLCHPGPQHILYKIGDDAPTWGLPGGHRPRLTTPS